MSHRFQILASVVSLALCTGWARAQDLQGRNGLWGSIGLGYGSFGWWTSFSCNHHVFGEAPGSLNAFATIGTGLAGRVSPALEVSGWVNDTGTSTIRMAIASAVVFVRPVAQTGLRLRSAVGVSASHHTGLEDDIILDERASGAAASLGVAYDLRVSPNMSLSPGLNLGVHHLAPGRLLDPSLHMWQLVIGVTWH